MQSPQSAETTVGAVLQRRSAWTTHYPRAVALIVPDITNPFFLEVAEGLQAAVEEAGVGVITCHTAGSTDRERAYIRMLVDIPILGVAMIPASETQPALHTFIDHQIPTVVIDRDLPGMPVDCLFSDNLSGGMLATRHLTDLGHRRIACVSGPAESFPGEGRVAGYREALRGAGIEPDPALILHSPFSTTAGAASACSLLQSANPPTAIFATSDMLAVGVLTEARDMGLRLPEELSVVGFDNIRLAALTTPPLTTVHQRKHEIGRQAGEMLLARISTPDAPFRRVLLATSLQIRASTMAWRG